MVKFSNIGILLVLLTTGLLATLPLANAELGTPCDISGIIRYNGAIVSGATVTATWLDNNGNTVSNSDTSGAPGPWFGIYQITSYANKVVTVTATYNGHSASITVNTQGSLMDNQGIDIVYIEPAPTADFAANRTVGATPLAVQFNDTSAGNPTSWAWDFNDDGIVDSNIKNPVHTYYTPGTYTVNLTVTNAAGNDDEVKNAFIVARNRIMYDGTVDLINGTAFDFAASSGITYAAGRATDLGALDATSLPYVISDAYYASMGAFLLDSIDGVANQDWTMPDYLSWFIVIDGVPASKGIGGNNLSDGDIVEFYYTTTDPTYAPDLDDYVFKARITANVITAPVAGFTSNLTTGIAPLAVQFNDMSANSPTTWAWDFNGDGIADSSVQNPVYTYDMPGTYAVKLTATNVAGSDDEVKTGYVAVNYPAPVAAFSGTPTSGESPLTVQFTDASAGTITSYAWDFDNNGNVDSTDASPSHTYNAPGTYTVKLTVTGPGGSDNEIKTNYIGVGYPAPVAAFSGTPTSGIAPLTVHFDSGTSTGNIASYAWDFDNNGNVDSTDASPTYTYNAPGTYTVKLTVTGPGGSDNEIKAGYITASALLPVAAFAADRTSGYPSLTVQFTDQSTGATSWQWDFDDDGNVDSTQQNPVHTFDAPGTYTVRLTAINAGGSDTEIRAGYISVYAIPMISVIPSSLSASAGASRTFEIRASSLPTGLSGISFNLSLDVPSIGEIVDASYPAWASLNVTWGISGDMVMISMTDLDHTIEAGASDVLLATLTVMGDLPGATSLAITEVDMDDDDGNALNAVVKDGRLDVYVGLAAEFAAAPAEGLKPLSVQFTDLTTGTPGPDSWLWDFGDGNTSTAQSPAYTYYTAGHYTVVLTVTNQYSTDSVTKTGLVAVIQPVEPFPGYSDMPGDLDGDGLYEDVNGNERFDFDDVVLLYQEMEWARNNANVGIGPYDFNGNGRLDFDDIVILYQEKLLD